MKAECRFSECDDCVFDGTDTICCMVSILGLAFHQFVLSIPVINLLASPKRCECFLRKYEADG